MPLPFFLSAKLVKPIQTGNIIEGYIVEFLSALHGDWETGIGDVKENGGCEFGILVFRCQ